MPLSTQRISPGRLEASYLQTFDRLRAAQAIEKILSKQPGLWKDDPAHARIITNRLGWIPVLDQMRAEAAELAAFAREVAAAGLRQIVLLGMGGSSLAPEVFSLIFPVADPNRRFLVLDTTDTDALLAADRAIDLPHALFVAASKSGKTVETLSQFHYFHQRLTQAGVSAPGRHFIAITDGGSDLDRLADEYQFRRLFRNPADIGGRYSALSYFGLVPAALWDVDIAAVLGAALEMRTACLPGTSDDANPALRLGALLGAAALHGDDKLALIATPTLEPLGNWIEQLIAESTGTEGKGIVPIAGAGVLPLDVLARGCVCAALVLEGDDETKVRAALAELEKRHAPVVEIRMPGRAQLGGEFFKWEVATAVAGAALAIDPFDEPNVQESKDNTARILAEFQSGGVMPVGARRASESGIELYADGAGQPASPFAEQLRTFFTARRPQDYLALLAYVERDPANTAQLEALRTSLAANLGMPVLMGFGPRYMHSIGQLYKGGPASGMFLVITAEHPTDLAIPGAKYTFSQLEMAQALGDLQSLGKRAKPSLRLHLTKGARQGLVDLPKVVERSLAAPRSAGS
jgi:transaldolase/glucose-6-phosphate isomerase